MAADSNAMRKADLIGVMSDLAQTCAIDGGAAKRCVAEFPRDARDATEFGFEADADLRITVLDSDYTGSLPALGDSLVFDSVTYRISEIIDDGLGVCRDLACVKR